MAGLVEGERYCNVGGAPQAAGGLYRMSDPQIQQQLHAAILGGRILAKIKERHTKRRELDEQILRSTMVKLVLPDVELPLHLTWKSYNTLRCDGYFEPIRQAIVKAHEIASRKLSEKDHEEILADTAADYEAHRKTFSRFPTYRKIFLAQGIAEAKARKDDQSARRRLDARKRVS